MITHRFRAVNMTKIGFMSKSCRTCSGRPITAFGKEAKFRTPRSDAAKPIIPQFTAAIGRSGLKPHRFRSAAFRTAFGSGTHGYFSLSAPEARTAFPPCFCRAASASDLNAAVSTGISSSFSSIPVTAHPFFLYVSLTVSRLRSTIKSPVSPSVRTV